MLDIFFYSKDRKKQEEVLLSEEYFELLRQSEFFKIGEETEKKFIDADGETQELPVVELNHNNREKLQQFFEKKIIQEDNKMLDKLGDSPSMQELKNSHEKDNHLRKKLHEIRKYVENYDYQYLVRNP